MKFCPNCGADISMEETLCINCAEPKSEKKPINIKLCPSMKIFYKGQWKKFEDIDWAIQNILNSVVSEDAELTEGIDLEILQKTGLKKQLEIQYIENKQKRKLKINTEITYSPQIAKMGSGYFEGVLQLRQATPIVQKFVKNYIIKTKELNIAKITGPDENPDIYFGSKKALKDISTKLINHFGGWMETNAKLFSQDKQTSKEIFRINILVKIAKFQPKDVIKINDATYLVTSVSDIINMIDLANEKKSTLKMTRELSELKPLKKYPLIITQTQPEIKGLNPITYEETRLENPLKLTNTPGQKVKAVITDKIYIVKN